MKKTKPKIKRSREKVRELFPKNYEFSLSDFFAACPFTIDQLLNKNRKMISTRWRQIYQVYSYMNGATLEEVAEDTKKDHSTVLFAISCVINAMEGFDILLKNNIDEVLNVTSEKIHISKDVYINEMISLVRLENEIQKKIVHLNSCTFNLS